MNHEVAFEEDSTRTETVDFDYEAVDAALGNALDQFAIAQSKIPRFEALILRKLLNWAVQSVPKNDNGNEIRVVILAWIFCPHLREKSLTEMAAMIGRDKQSLGRWVDDFKVEFPNVLKHERTNQNSRARASRAGQKH